jgi:hypothetical protein
MWTDGRTERHEAIVAFRNFANTSEHLLYCRNIRCIVINIDGVSVVFNENYQRPRLTVLNGRTVKRNR